jgi:uncharacterized protein
MSTSWRLLDANSGDTVVECLQLADRFWSRIVGWQFCQSPGTGHGLLIVPCNSIHTCFVRFSLDVTLLDRGGRVVAVHKNVRPWRIVLPSWSAHAVLEVPAGGVGFHVGQRLCVADPGGIQFRKSLQFLRNPEEREETGRRTTAVPGSGHDRGTE